jgi:hypothetical protein
VRKVLEQHGIQADTDVAMAYPGTTDAVMHHEPETAIAVLGKYLQSSDRELMRAAYESFRPAYSRNQLVPEEAVVATLHDLEHPAARTADPKSFYNNSYLERIKASGYLDRLYAGR